MISNFGRIFIYFFLLVFIDVYGDFFFMDIIILELDVEFKEVFELIKK